MIADIALIPFRNDYQNSIVGFCFGEGKITPRRDQFPISQSWPEGSLAEIRYGVRRFEYFILRTLVDN